MATLTSIQRQIAELQKKAEQIIKKESAQAIAKVRELIEKYGLTSEDIGLSGRARAAATKRSSGQGKGGRKKSATSVGVPVYRDPDTGKTWTGRGKPPTWIAGMEDRTRFLIAPSEVASSSRTSKTAKPRAAKKAGRAATSVGAKRASQRRNAVGSLKASPNTGKPTKNSAPTKKASGRKSSGKVAKVGNEDVASAEVNKDKA
jgi:DNA-binding protein H-NS